MEWIALIEVLLPLVQECLKNDRIRNEEELSKAFLNPSGLQVVRMRRALAKHGVPIAKRAEVIRLARDEFALMSSEEQLECCGELMSAAKELP